MIPGIPLDEWHIGKFDDIPANSVTVSSTGMTVTVKESAGPIIHAFNRARRISGFRVSGSLSGLPHIQDGQQQGDKDADDFPLRIGFVLVGGKHLNAFQRFIAADWVKYLYDAAPAGIGLDRVQFFTLTQRPELVGKTRVHPDSELIHETFFAAVDKVGPFNHEYRLPAPVEAFAVWIDIDGDDTGSRYSVTINKLEIEETGS